LTQQESGVFPHAPKIYDEHCKIDWHKTAIQIFNQVRGLSPYPGAYTTWNEKKLKLFKVEILDLQSTEIGLLEINSNKEFIAHCSDYQIKIIDLQIEGKKRMSTSDFVNGLKL
jgi:methionyl-tRNA formyltransferase